MQIRTTENLIHEKILDLRSFYTVPLKVKNFVVYTYTRAYS